MMQGIERFIKQSIVDRNPAVAAAALVSSLHMFGLNKEVVKRYRRALMVCPILTTLHTYDHNYRWANEVQEAISSKGPSAQYQALGLLYLMRSHDKIALIKMVHAFARVCIYLVSVSFG
jgi:coatomer protein complex subunit gamma